MPRFIGITHRVKRTVVGEPRPTIVTILEGDKSVTYKLADETEEMDFIEGRYPVGYTDVVDGQDLSAYLDRQLKKKKDPATKEEKVVKVPITFEGLRSGDIVAMTLGGSGNYLAYAIARKCRKLGSGAEIIRITPKQFCDLRGVGKKEADAELLATLARERRELFLAMRQADLDQIKLTIAWRDRIDAMKARIACEQRLFQRLIGRTFVEEGLAPERTLELAFLEAKASNTTLKALEIEERARIVDVEKLVRQLPVYQQIFEPLEGCGPMIATRLVVAIGDIRRFATAAKLKKFCGVACTSNGAFARKRSGEVANWHPDARQALYLIGDQFNQRPRSPWGQMLRRYKVTFREKHPERINPETGKKQYGPAHIHRMATWRTITKFVEWLWREWSKIAPVENNEGENAAAA